MNAQTDPPANPPEQPSLDDAPPPEPSKEEQTGYMLYDLTEKRFVGRKADTAKAAGETVPVREEGHEYETRKV